MSRKSILLIDSNPALLRDLAQRCHAIGLNAFTAEDGRTAVEILENKKPDLLCLDDRVPGGDGLRLCEMVLASPDDVSCPVIVLVADARAARQSQPSAMCVYHVQKRPDLWRYLEPVIFELVDIQPVSRRPTDQERDRTGRVS